MRIDILDSPKKKNFLNGISYLGDFKTNLLFLASGGEAIRAYSGHLTTNELLKIWRHFPVEGLGLYFGKQLTDRHGRREARIGLDALHLMKNQISRNIVELNEEQAGKWFRGNNIELNSEQKEKCREMKDFVAVKYKEDFVGTGKLTNQGILLSFLPKERRIRN